MTTYIAGLDIGTSSVKLSLWDLQAEQVILQSTQDYRVFQDNRGWVYQDANEVYQAVLKQLAEAIDKLNEIETNSRKLMIVVLDTALHTLLLLDKEMNPMTNVIPWIDERADSIAREISGTELAKEIHKRTGCPVDPVYPLYKLMWFKRNEPELLGRAYKIASIKDFILFKLTGQFVIDFAVASGTGYFDMRKRQWAKELLRDLVGIQTASLPDLVSPYQQFDTCERIKALAETSRTSVKIVAGISDAAASSIGVTLDETKLMTVSMGTSAAVRRISAKPLPEDKMPNNGIWCYMVDEDRYVIGLALKNGGCLLEWWMKNFLGNADYSQISKLLAELLQPSYSLPASVRPIFIPTVHGMRSPRWIPGRTGALLNLSGTTNIIEATKAILEGLAFNLRRAFETVSRQTKDLGEISDVVATGGMCQITNWLNFLATILDRRIITRQNRYDAANGAILLYLKGTSRGLLRKLAEENSIFLPEERVVPIYDELYSRWLKEMRRLERR